MRVVGPVRATEPDSVPVDLCAAQHLVEAQSEALPARISIPRRRWEISIRTNR